MQETPVNSIPLGRTSHSRLQSNSSKTENAVSRFCLTSFQMMTLFIIFKSSPALPVIYSEINSQIPKKLKWNYTVPDQCKHPSQLLQIRLPKTKALKSIGPRHVQSSLWCTSFGGTNALVNATWVQLKEYCVLK